MKATREELMSFFNYVVKRMSQSERFNREVVTDDYIKLINSESGNKTPTVTDNEAKEEFCQCSIVFYNPGGPTGLWCSFCGLPIAKAK